MSESELLVAGIGVSRDVLTTIVTLAAERVEGVVRVGGNDIASSLISVFTSKSTSPEAAVESVVEGGDLRVTVRLAVFYGYPFIALASNVRQAVAAAIREQVGVEPKAVDVCIDSLVFPKE